VVWAKVPEPERFVAALLAKAGLPAGEWPDGTLAWRYSTDDFAG
jgi:hypothetical protein